MPKIKVLIVEDETLIALQLKMQLTKAGLDVCQPTGRGEDAIKLARRENPDVILMDISLLGDMDGIETAKNIKSFSNARIIFTTGHSDLTLKERAMALKPTAYLLKPVGVSQINAALAPFWGGA